MSSTAPGRLGEEALAVEIGQAGHRLGHPLPQGQGELPVGPVGPGGVVGDIAGEQLVGPLPGQDHLHVPGGQPGQEVQGDGGQIGVGLVGVILDGGQDVEELLGGDGLGDVPQAQLPAQVLGLLGLVKALPVKAHRVGLVRPGQGGDDAGVDAPGQEGAHLHVADLVGLHRLGDHLPDLPGPVVQGLVLGLEGEGVVGGDLRPALPIEQLVAGQQPEHPLQEGLVQSGVLEGEVELQGLGVELLAEGGVGEEALQLGAEEEGVPHGGVVQGLDAEGVPGGVQFPLCPVPHHEGEHPPQLPGEGGALLGVALEDDLGVRVGGEGAAPGDQLLAQLLEVVHLAVVGQDEIAVGAGHGLVAVGQVDDGQPPVGDGAGVVHIIALVVGAPVADAVRHGLQGLPVGGGAGDEAGNAAHRVILHSRAPVRGPGLFRLAPVPGGTARGSSNILV